MVDTAIVGEFSKGLTDFIHSNLILLFSLAALGCVIYYAIKNKDAISETFSGW